MCTLSWVCATSVAAALDLLEFDLQRIGSGLGSLGILAVRLACLGAARAAIGADAAALGADRRTGVVHARPSSLLLKRFIIQSVGDVGGTLRKRT